MNHQDIADRLKSLGDEKSKALVAEEARIERERLSFQELCGGMGHVYITDPNPFAWKRMSLYGVIPRICAVCGKEEV